jgi:hypothetical protein
MMIGTLVAGRQPPADSVRPGIIVVAWFLALCAVLAVADVSRRHEKLFYANLGMSQISVVAWYLLPALIGESLIRLIWRV